MTLLQPGETAEVTADLHGNTTWLGTKKVAFIPVFRPSYDAGPPSDWAQQIQARIYFDPDAGGADVSLRSYLHATSYGRASIEGQVLPMVTLDRLDVAVDALAADYQSQLVSQGFDAAAIVMLGGVGAGSAQLGGFWARFVMAERVGVWAMELTHALTGYSDLYVYPDNLGSFDNMACSCGTHPSAFTKQSFGWLDGATIHTHVGRGKSYDLHTLGLLQPPPPGRCAAVRVQTSPHPFIVEARQKVDPFDGRIPSAGVIVYEVENPDLTPNPAWTQPVLKLRTPTALQPGQMFTSSTGVTVTVAGALAGGFTVRIDDPTPGHSLDDRSAEFGTPPAASAPSVAFLPALGSYNIAYRDTSGRLHELWRDSLGHTGTTDLTANASAPTATGNPFAYVDTARNTEILLYRSGDGVVRSLYWSTGAVGADNLSGTAGAPKAAGDPVGYYVPETDTHHVFYRTGDGHIHELFWVGITPVQYGGDVTAMASAPGATGDLSAFHSPNGDNIVLFRSADGHIRSLYWSGSGTVGTDDLSGYAGTPKAAGDPVGYYTAHDDVQQIVYRGVDGRLYELYWQGEAPVVGWDISTPAGAPAASLNPAAYYSAGTNTKHVMYRSPDGRLHELWWVPGGGTPGHVDLTAYASAPLAADRPAAFTIEGPNTQHVAYRATDGHIWEIRWW